MTGPVRIRIVAARRGHGATTVAVAVASYAAGAGRNVTLLVDELDDACAVCGVPTPAFDEPVPVAPGLTLARAGLPIGEPTDFVVEDIGRLDGDSPAGITLLVVRGPDYLSLRTALAHPIRAHGVVVIREPWRALGPADVASVLGIPVVAEVPHSDAVARATDAGLLVCRGAAMRPFRHLQRIVTEGLHPAVAAGRRSTIRSAVTGAASRTGEPPEPATLAAHDHPNSPPPAALPAPISRSPQLPDHVFGDPRWPSTDYAASFLGLRPGR